ncbi:hypothetical protein GCM10023170_003700 [Phytohabitans houttuyneae]|uniref:Uncharacterized protein n=1 Tax=Phytohabitans houttuyneae TaxID=1076126 RepID=A0A6V8K0V8_9ACTN|nr:hypothetical protein Phou_029120 [Phytohabitans houttuyneae]
MCVPPNLGAPMRPRTDTDPRAMHVTANPVAEGVLNGPPRLTGTPARYLALEVSKGRRGADEL